MYLFAFSFRTADCQVCWENNCIDLATLDEFESESVVRNDLSLLFCSFIASNGRDVPEKLNSFARLQGVRACWVADPITWAQMSKGF